MISHKLLFIPMAAMLALPVPGISQQLIDINFNKLETGTLHAAGPYSGSKATDDWNTFTATSQSGQLNYSDGTASQLLINYSSQSGAITTVGSGSSSYASSGIWANTSALMDGYLDNAISGSPANPATIQISGLAPGLSVQVYALVYGSLVANQTGRYMNLTVNGATSSTQKAGPSAATFASWNQGVNYLVFSTTADSSGTITILMSPTGTVPSGEWAEADLNGLQLVGALNTPPACQTTISPGGLSFPAAGGTATVNVTAAGCGWSSSNDGNKGITITSGSSGTGNGTVGIQVAANTGAESSTTITVAGNPFTIQQDTEVTAGYLQPVGSLAHIASGGSWDTTLTLVNPTSAVVEAELVFSGNGGSALGLPFTFPQQAGGAQMLGATWDQILLPNASLIIDTPGVKGAGGSLSTGWAQLLATNAAGFAVFTDEQTGQAAVVPLETRNASSYLLAFDNTEVVSTGLAIANVAATAANVNVVIRDNKGNQVGTGSVNLPAQGHTSNMLPAMFASTASIRGTVEFDTPTGGQISVLGLRANGSALTTLPVLANVGTAGGTLAHYAAGGGGTAGNGWQTTFTLVNTGTSAASATLNFFDSTGVAASLPLSYPQKSTTATADSVSQTIEAGASLIVVVQDTGGSTTLEGSAVLTTSGNVSGFAIFRDNPTGQEAVVPLLVDNASSYVLAFDNTNGLATGLAIANIAAQAADVSVVLRDDTGAQIGTGSISLPGQGHASFMLTDATQGFPLTANKRGTIEFVTPQGGQISPLGLRASPNGASGYAITTIPVIEKAAAAGVSNKKFAPYIDMSIANNNDLSSIASESGITAFTLAFITGNNGCTASWSGEYNIPGETTIQPIISAFSKTFGAANAIVSFGGSAAADNNNELAEVCNSAAATQAQYQAVVNYYGVKSLDFDIEGGALTTTTSIDQRNQALAALQAANPGLTISYSLPATPTGLTAAGVSLLSNAVKHGVNVAVVNVLAMDYGGNDSQMGADAVNATLAAETQVLGTGLNSTMGCTPMIGQNDTPGEIFTLADAQKLVSSANQFSYVTRLSYWSVARDNGNCAGDANADASCSGVAQNLYQFASIFEQF